MPPSSILSISLSSLLLSYHPPICRGLKKNKNHPSIRLTSDIDNNQFLVQSNCKRITERMESILKIGIFFFFLFQPNNFNAVIPIIRTYLDNHSRKRKQREKQSKKNNELKDNQTPNSTLSGNPLINPFCCVPLANQCRVLSDGFLLRRSTSIDHSSPLFILSF